ncbi:MAG TPA: arylesterase [Gammaproteobacteria bacterium]|nr:arylesterase [Gammaproteobacteria bacterium]
MRRILLFALLLAFPALAAAAPTRTVLVMGDSLSAAYGLEVSQGWVTLLQARLKAQGHNYTVVNGSVSGETAEGGLTRLPQELQNARPAVVILELGANDGLRGLPLNTLEDNLGRMIVLSSKAGAKVLLVGILLPPNYGPDYTRGFTRIYVSLAKRYKLPLVPFLLAGVAEHRELMQADGLHPIAAAEPKVLDNVWSRLLPLLDK